MKDRSDERTTRVEEQLLDTISIRYSDALMRWVRKNKALFSRLKGIRDDDPMAAQKRLAILRKTGAARSLALALSDAGSESVRLIADAMTEVEALNLGGDDFGVPKD